MNIRDRIKPTSKTSEYRIWASIKQRCFNPNNPSYHHYGGRGITMCDEWQDSFVAFSKDMGKRPSLRHSIDRKDNDGDYSADNCRWATQDQQTINSRMKPNRTGHKGIYPQITRGINYGYCVCLCVDYYIIYLGVDKDLDNAIMLRMAGEEQLRNG